MPNHVTTILTIEDAGGMALADIRKAFVNAKGLVDLDVVLPKPACLNGFEPHMGILSRAKAALGLLPDPKKLAGNDFVDLTARMELSSALRDVTTPVRDGDSALVVRAIQNYNECGYLYWYDWCNDNWGTKWNCYGQPDEGHPVDATSFEFETAWAHPDEMVARISSKLPGVVFHVLYADEDLGSNCGEYRIRSGAKFDEDIAGKWDDRSKADQRRWMERAFYIRYGKDEPPAAHGYDENWEYSDDVYEQYEAKSKLA